MASKWQLENDNNRLEILKENLNSFAKNQQSASNTSTSMSNTLKNHYKIDDDSNKACERIDKLAKELSEDADYLLNTVIPAIDEQIAKNKKEIERIEEEERRKEEERKASSIKFRW